MEAQELTPGITFKRKGHYEFREVERIDDMDELEPDNRVMKNKLRVHCTNGDKFLIYKTDTVHLKTN